MRAIKSLKASLGAASLGALCRGVTAVLALAAATPASAGTIFIDGTFDLTGYSATVGLVNGGASIAALQCPYCGNPNGLGLQITGTFANAPPPPDLFTAVEVLINNAFLYTPSVQGAITSLSASVDKNLSPATRCCSG
jgi:hypothetical protein